MMDGGAKEAIVPVPVKKRKGDEGPRRDASLERLGKLKPAFKEGGTVTAGNSSPLNDEAVALVVSFDFAQAHGLRRWPG